MQYMLQFEKYEGTGLPPDLCTEMGNQIPNTLYLIILLSDLEYRININYMFIYVIVLGIWT